MIIVNSTFKNTLPFFFQEKEVENVVSIMAAICLSLNVLNDNDSDTVFRMPSYFVKHFFWLAFWLQIMWSLCAMLKDNIPLM